MASASYEVKRGELRDHFDRTAAQAWKNLTSDAPVGRIRTRVRAGREAMQRTLLDWLPADLRGARVLDAGCGTGVLACELARRGASVVAVDLSPTLLALAEERGREVGPGRVDFRVGDMSDATLGRFDHVVAMDSLIHYTTPDMVDVLGRFLERAETSVVFTFTPRTLMLRAMLAAGRRFPRGLQSPSVEPVAQITLLDRLEATPAFRGWAAGRDCRVATAFYISQAQELVAT